MPSIRNYCLICMFKLMKKIFLTQPHIPLIFQKISSRNPFRDGTAQYCSDLPSHSHYQPSDINSLFKSIMMKPISTWLLAIETSMLQTFPKVYPKALRNLLIIHCRTHSILLNHYHCTPLFFIKILKSISFWTNENHFVKVHSKFLPIFWKSHVNSDARQKSVSHTQK